MKKYQVLLFCFLVIFLISPKIVNAESVQITTSKTTYSYGDYLSIIIKVPKVTDDKGIMHIIDKDGVKSSAIAIQIIKSTTTITSPNPFDYIMFKEGKYQIEFEYAGQKSVTRFDLVDSGNIVMPLGSDVVVSKWANREVSDYIILKFLSDKNLIKLDSQTVKEDVKIPSWYKTNGLWWSDKKISDSEFVNGLQYLLDREVILV